MRKDGSRFWAHVVIDPIRSPDGVVIGYAKVTRDLTERKAVEAVLAKRPKISGGGAGQVYLDPALARVARELLTPDAVK